MRSDICELCGSSKDLSVYELVSGDEEKSAVVCATCKGMIENPDTLEPNHFRCLSDSMWSEQIGVQALSYRILKRIDEDWARSLVDMMYLEDSVLEWAEDSKGSDIVHKDSNGTTLNEGDTVTLIKDLDVKGAGFTAKRGTAVRNIRLTDNPEQIEGKVNGVQIVLLTKFLKKA